MRRAPAARARVMAASQKSRIAGHGKELRGEMAGHRPHHRQQIAAQAAGVGRAEHSPRDAFGNSIAWVAGVTKTTLAGPG